MKVGRALLLFFAVCSLIGCARSPSYRVETKQTPSKQSTPTEQKPRQSNTTPTRILTRISDAKYAEINMVANRSHIEYLKTKSVAFLEEAISLWHESVEVRALGKNAPRHRLRLAQAYCLLSNRNKWLHFLQEYRRIDGFEYESERKLFTRVENMRC